MGGWVEDGGGRRGDGGGEQRLVAVPQKTGFFFPDPQGEALHCSTDSLAREPQEETFGKITAPPPHPPSPHSPPPPA